jgi:hypothetical protein
VLLNSQFAKAAQNASRCRAKCTEWHFVEGVRLKQKSSITIVDDWNMSYKKNIKHMRSI